MYHIDLNGTGTGMCETKMSKNTYLDPKQNNSKATHCNND